MQILIMIKKFSHLGPLNKMHKIKLIKSFEEVDFDKFEIDDFIMFDVDHTILTTDDIYAQYMLSSQSHCSEKIAFIKEKFADKFDDNNHIGLVMKNIKMNLIEENLIEKIKALQNRGIFVIAITAMPTGFNSGLGQSWQEWRFDKLNKIGFNGSFQDFAFVLNNENYRRPIFYKGIIFTDFTEKGPVFENFLDKFNKIVNNEKTNINFLKDHKNCDSKMQKTLKQKRVIMFDDTISNLESMMKFCKEKGIEFNGYHYQPYEIEDFTSEQDEIVNFKINKMINENKWICDESAKNLINKN